MRESALRTAAREGGGRGGARALSAGIPDDGDKTSRHLCRLDVSHTHTHTHIHSRERMSAGLLYRRPARLALRRCRVAGITGPSSIISINLATPVNPLAGNRGPGSERSFIFVPCIKASALNRVGCLLLGAARRLLESSVGARWRLMLIRFICSIQFGLQFSAMYFTILRTSPYAAYTPRRID